jgi:uncharacterized membrane protein (DUF4010 family)
VTAVLIGIASNNIVKSVLATVVGGIDFGKRVAAALGLMIVAGAAGVLAAWL